MEAKDLFSEAYLEETCTLGGMRFRFEKLLPREAMRAFNRLRPGLGEALVNVPIGLFPRLNSLTAADKAQLRIMLWAKIPAETVELAELLLFPHVYWQGANAQGEAQLAGAEDIVFQTLALSEIEEVLVRSFAVNFSQYFVALLSGLNTSQSSTSPNPSVLNPSSLPVSPQDSSL